MPTILRRNPLAYVEILSGVAMLLFLLACDPPTACTQIGCDNTLAIRVVTEDEQMVVGLVGTITIGETTYDVDCTGTSSPEVRCDDDAIRVTVTEDQVDLEVGIDLFRDDGYGAATSFTPTWTSSQPNGPDCPPVCWQGEAGVAADFAR